MEGASSISVVVRLRPFSQKELQLQPNPSSSSTNPTLFNSDSTTSTTSISSTFTTPQPPRHAAGAIRKVLKVLDDRILVFDPPENTAVTSFKGLNLPPVLGKKVKDIRFCFDRVFDEGCGQEEVYEGSAKELVGHVMNGFHSTVFAYGVSSAILLSSPLIQVHSNDTYSYHRRRDVERRTPSLDRPLNQESSF